MFTYVALILGLFVEVIVGLKESSGPLLYPQKSQVVVNAHTDLVLGCRGAEPLRWTFRDPHNGPYYNPSQENVIEMNNTFDLLYTFETILTVYNVSHINIGFYYCHGKKTDFDTPRRSRRIYVFVQDDNNLSVITSEKYNFSSNAWFVFFPCRPTSPDINITLMCYDDELSMSVTPSNYSALLLLDDYDGKMEFRFNPYVGFTSQSDLFVNEWKNCICEFRRNIQAFTMRFDSDSDYVTEEFHQTYMEGPDTVNVGDTITLQCTTLIQPTFPYYKFWLQWNFYDAPVSENNMMTNDYLYKLKHYVLHISVLTITNISSENEGYYKCELIRYSQYSMKYVAVLEKKVGYTSPRIYPDQDYVQMNSGENLTLRCEGSRPITWSWGKEWDKKCKPFTYNNERIENGIRVYELYLYFIEPRHTRVGYYYCHEYDYIKEHPYKSDKIYVFIKDDMYFIAPGPTHFSTYAYANETVPCRPTSREVHVTLSMAMERFDQVQSINPVIYGYDAREGFTVQMPQIGRLIVTCTYTMDTRKAAINITYLFRKALNSQPHIKGPNENFVLVGDTLELSCNVAVYHNVADDALRWIIPNNSTANHTTIERINVRGEKVLHSKLILYNVKNIDEGHYNCYLSHNNATEIKFISVFDNYDLKPFIEDLKYGFAYIGQPLTLRCGLNIDHNVNINMDWNISNATDKHRIIGKVYIMKVRHVQVQITLQIDNVTYENKGNYSCYVSDLTNKRENVTKYVRVKRGEKPKMNVETSYMKKPEDIDVLINGKANLTCPARGDPKPTIIWMKETSQGVTQVETLGEHINFSADNSELTIFYVQRIDAGLYTCIAQNPFGNISRDVHLHVKSDSTGTIIIAVLVCLIIMSCVVAVAFVKFESMKKTQRKGLLEAGLNNFRFGEIEQATLLDYDRKWEIPRNKIVLGRNLGAGYFGFVVEATVSNYFVEEPVKTVAVKMLHQNCNLMDLYSLISELKILAHFGKHANLINLLGACTEDIVERKLLVVIEYCKHGSLRNFLIENRNNFVNLIDPDTKLICLTGVEETNKEDGDLTELQRITTLELERWALQVARGMEFLASRKVMHGDLAARNVLLTENYVIKISDFGLSKTLNSSDYYRKKSQCPLPVKWMALESIRDKTFTMWSDVWSFGVVLWELFSLARTPYAELEPDFRFYRKLESGYRLSQPEYSTKEIYQVMRECWCAQPQCRPTFPRLVQTLDDLSEHLHAPCSSDTREQFYINKSDESSPAASSRDAKTTAQDWISLNVLTSETCMNTEK